MALQEMIPVTSSKIKSIGYSAPEMALYVEFMNGDTWRYWTVRSEEFEDLLASDSVGAAQGRLVKDKHANKMHMNVMTGNWMMEK